MPDRAFSYSESILQWIWSELLYDPQQLQTTCGQRIRILDPGELNHGDGPDFRYARIRIGEKLWCGSVEIHPKSKSWVDHKHHQDPNYDNVILHVVAERESSRVVTHNSASLYTLNLFPFIDPQLHAWLGSHFNTKFPPCSSNLRFLNKQAFNSQIEKAHQEYLEQKVQDFFQRFRPGQLLSVSWKEALITSIFDGLGISGNRDQMNQLAAHLLNAGERTQNQVLQLAFEYAFGRNSSIRWNLKSGRGANHPKNRIIQGTRLLSIIQTQPFEGFLDARELKESWLKLLDQAGIAVSPRFDILFGTVYLPSMYALGTLLAHIPLQQRVLRTWRLLDSPLPAFVNRYFEPLLEDRKPLIKLGAVHQLRHYCKEHRCSDCLVLKKVIQG